MEDFEFEDYRTFLTIAASDCIGGAGIQADIKAAREYCVYSASVVTAVTAQNSRGVVATMPMTPEIVRRQLECVFQDFTPDAIKIGLLPTPEIVETVNDFLEEHLSPNTPVIIDPVLSPSFGNDFGDTRGVATAMLDGLLQKATLITPNEKELRLLVEAITDSEEKNEIKDLVGFLHLRGIDSILVTGGDTSKGTYVTDTLYRFGQKPYQFKTERVDTSNLHGTGCLFSSQIACNLARNGTDRPIEHVIDFCKKLLAAGLDLYKDFEFGSGYGPADFFVDD